MLNVIPEENAVEEIVLLSTEPEIEAPTHNDVMNAIKRLKNNKTAGSVNIPVN